MNPFLCLMIVVLLALAFYQNHCSIVAHRDWMRLTDRWEAQRERYIQQLTGVRFSPPEPGPRRAYGTDEDEWAVDQRRRAEGRESGEPV